jgi:hypothetical protein
MPAYGTADFEFVLAAATCLVVGGALAALNQHRITQVWIGWGIAWLGLLLILCIVIAPVHNAPLEARLIGCFQATVLALLFGWPLLGRYAANLAINDPLSVATRTIIDAIKSGSPTDRTRLVTRLTAKADQWDNVLADQEQTTLRWIRTQTPVRPPSDATIEEAVKMEVAGIRSHFDLDRAEIASLLREVEKFYLDSPELREYLKDPPEGIGGFQNAPHLFRDLAAALSSSSHDEASASSALLRLASDLRAFREFYRADLPDDDTDLDEETALAHQRRFLVRIAGAINLLAPRGLTDPNSTELWSWPENMGDVMLTATTFESLAQHL